MARGVDILNRFYSKPRGVDILGKNYPSQASLPSMKAAPEAADNAPPKKVSGLMDRLAQVAHGMATGPANTADLFRKLSSYGTDIDNPQDVKERSEYFNKHDEGKLEKYVSGKIKKAYGKDLKGEDSLGKALNFAGEALSVDPSKAKNAYNLLKAGIPAIKPALKSLAKQGASAFGGGAAIHMTPRLAEEGSKLGMVEDVVKGVAGTALTPKVAKGAFNFASHPVKSTKQIGKNALMYALLAGTKPNVKASLLQSAEQIGIKLPFNTGLGNQRANWVANTGLNRNLFTSDKYNNYTEETRKGLTSHAGRVLGGISPHSRSPGEASREYQRALSMDRAATFADNTNNYQFAQSKVSPTDTIKPDSTVKAINEIYPIINTDVGLPGKERVRSIVDEQAKKWGLSTHDHIAAMMAGQGMTPKSHPDVYKYLLKQQGRARQGTNRGQFGATDKPYKYGQDPVMWRDGNVFLGDAINASHDLNQSINFDPMVKGQEAHLNRLGAAVRDDIYAAENQAAVNAFHDANRYYEERIGKRHLNSNEVNNLIKDKLPTDASIYMTTPERVKFLEEVSHGNPALVGELNALKRSKVEQMFSLAMTDEGFSPAHFSKVFAKNDNRRLLRSLMPRETWSQLSEIRKISNEMYKNGKEMFNTSGTAIASSNFADMKRAGGEAKKMVWGVGQMLAGGKAGAFFGPAGALVGTSASAALPNVVSRMLGDPAFIKELRTFAIARQQGRAKQAGNAFNRMMKIGEPQAAAAINALKTSTTDKESKE